MGRCSRDEPCAALNPAHLATWGECWHVAEGGDPGDVDRHVCDLRMVPAVEEGPVDAAICIRLLVLFLPGWSFLERADDAGYGIFLVPSWLTPGEVDRMVGEVHERLAHDRGEIIDRLRRVAAAPNN